MAKKWSKSFKKIFITLVINILLVGQFSLVNGVFFANDVFANDTTANNQVVIFPDKFLEGIIRGKLGLKNTGDITLTNITFLTELNKGMELAYKSGISNLSGLEHAINLKYLFISSDSVSDLSPLRNLTGLERLTINGSQIKDLSPLKNLINLKSLEIINVSADDYSVLSNMRSLENLRLEPNVAGISDLSFISNMTALKYATISNGIDNKKIKQIPSVDNLKNLEKLWLTGHVIQDLSPLKSLPNLQELWLNNNKIRDISPLRQLTNLKQLIMDNNEISDLSPLVEMVEQKNSKLNYVTLGKNYLDLTRTSKNWADLKRIEIKVNYLSFDSPRPVVTVTDADTIVSGTAEPSKSVAIFRQDGGRAVYLTEKAGKVDETGHFSVSIKEAQKAGTKIVIMIFTPNVGDSASSMNNEITVVSSGKAQPNGSVVTPGNQTESPTATSQKNGNINQPNNPTSIQNEGVTDLNVTLLNSVRKPESNVKITLWNGMSCVTNDLGTCTIQKISYGSYLVHENRNNTSQEIEVNAHNNTLTLMITTNTSELHKRPDLEESKSPRYFSRIFGEVSYYYISQNMEDAGVTRGAKVIMKDENGIEVASTITDDGGNYSFKDVKPGKYTIVSFYKDFNEHSKIVTLKENENVKVKLQVFKVWAKAMEDYKKQVSQIKILIHNEMKRPEQSPVLVNGTTLVPMRFIFEELGAKITWNGETKMVTAIKGNITVIIAIDKEEAKVNGKYIKLAEKAQLINGNTMVPLRFVSESLGAKVEWDGINNEVLIKMNND